MTTVYCTHSAAKAIGAYTALKGMAAVIDNDMSVEQIRSLLLKVAAGYETDYQIWKAQNVKR